MRWRQARRSTNVEDRRGQRFPGGRRGVSGCGCLALVVFGGVYLLLGGDPAQLVGMVEQVESQQPRAPRQPRPRGQQPGGPPPQRMDDEAADFVSVVLASTEDVWGAIFANAGSRYEPPTLVVFDDATPTACGFGRAATGPFYCPADRQVYIDLGFFAELKRLGAPGDFAQAYVIAHEVGHHIQTLVGTSDEVRRLQSAARSREESNRYQVLMELQADCYAGVWGHHAQRMLEPGDVEEGLRAAAAIGDDRLQRRAGRYVSPESWTHGSSRQRQEWLTRGLQSGDYSDCDTFAAAGL